jgi:hypothetical protein
VKPTIHPPDPDEQLFGTRPVRVAAGDSVVRSIWAVIVHRRLDRRIAQGADPLRSGAIAARARQLTKRRRREKTATLIDRVLCTVDEPDRWRLRVHPAAEAVRAARSHLERISELLRSDSPVYARGVALSRALLHDVESPLFSAADGGAAWYWAQLATHALEGHV